MYALCATLTRMSDSVVDQPMRSPAGSEAMWTLPSLARRPARLSALVIDVLIERIVSGELPSGALLPPEPALCRSFGVSRSVVREALKVLEEKGLVTVHQGFGTSVAKPEEWNLLDPVVLSAVVRHDEQRQVVDDLVAVRAVLEAGMAARAAVSRSPEDLHDLRSVIEELKSSLDEPVRYSLLDTRFHDELMRISGNRLARVVVDSIHRQARTSAGYNEYVPEDVNLTHRGHLAILEQIEAGNQEGAADAMRNHIMSMWRRKRERSSSLDGATAG